MRGEYRNAYQLLGCAPKVSFAARLLLRPYLQSDACDHRSRCAWEAGCACLAGKMRRMRMLLLLLLVAAAMVEAPG